MQVQVDEVLPSGDDVSVATKDDEDDQPSVTEEGPRRYNYYLMKKVEKQLDSLPHIIIDL